MNLRVESINIKSNQKISFGKKERVGTKLVPLINDTFEILLPDPDKKEKKKRLSEMKAKFKEMGINPKTCSASELFDALGWKYVFSQEGLLIPEKYEKPDMYYNFKDIGVDENRLLKEIGGIDGYAYLHRVKDLGNIRYIRGEAIIGYRVKNLGKLEEIDGPALFFSKKLKDIGNLQSIGGRINLKNTSSLKYEDFRNIDCPSRRAEIKLNEWGVDFKTCSTKQLFDAFDIKYEVDPDDGLLILENYKQPDDFWYSDLGIDENRLFKDIKEIKGDYSSFKSNVTDFGNLQVIGGNADFSHSKATSLGKIRIIGGNARLATGSNLRDLGNLETIGGNADFSFAPITRKMLDLKNLKNISGNVDIRYSKLQRSDFENIKVGGKIID